MAGLGSRFKEQGYEVPKQFIYVKDKQLIDLSIDSIDTSDCNLIFIVRDEQVYNYNVDELLKAKFGNDIQIVVTEGLTKGSVCSCLLARDLVDNELPLFIHTLDIEFFPQLNPATFVQNNFDGNMLTFKSNSSNYSYAKINDQNKVVRTAEKKVISNDACVGIYYFKTGKLFCEYAELMIEKDLRTNNEFYISPLYNLLIDNGLTVGISKVEKMHIFGTPKEYNFYRHNVIKQFGKKPIALCSDHSGYVAKERFRKILDSIGFTYIDFGTYVGKDCDYIPYVEQAGAAVNDRTCDFGFITLCL